MTDPQPLLAALADPTRRALFERLSAEGPASASSLARAMPITRQAVAKHMAVLDEAGLVERRAVGREIEFVARPAALGGVTDWISRVGSEWDDKLERLRRSFD